MIQSNQEDPDLSHFKDNHIHYTQLKHTQLVTFLSPVLETVLTYSY